MFGLSGAGSLQQVLTARGSTDHVAGFSDDLSWGPIGEARLAERIAYMEKEDPFPPEPSYWRGLPKAHENFWHEASRETDERIIWLGSNNACELAGYLAYLDRFPDLPVSVIRPDDYLPEHPRYGKAGAIGVLNAEQLADALDHAPRRAAADDATLFGRWAELVQENALLRSVSDGSLISVPISHYDHFVIGAASSDWTRHVRVVGHALAATFDAKVWVNTELLFSRLAHLVDEGILEADGDVRAYTEDFRRSEAKVRLARR